MDELFISTDIESTGPVPGLYSMYQLGACVVGDDEKRFYAELSLISDGFVPEALAACGTTMPELRAKGEDPETIMRRFVGWTTSVAAGRKPVLVAFAATFPTSRIRTMRSTTRSSRRTCLPRCWRTPRRRSEPRRESLPFRRLFSFQGRTVRIPPITLRTWPRWSRASRPSG